MKNKNVMKVMNPMLVIPSLVNLPSTLYESPNTEMTQSDTKPVGLLCRWSVFTHCAVTHQMSDCSLYVHSVFKLTCFGHHL